MKIKTYLILIINNFESVISYPKPSREKFESVISNSNSDLWKVSTLTFRYSLMQNYKNFA
jgi:hypothetical protein